VEGNPFEPAPRRVDRPMTRAPLRVGVAPGDDEPYECRGRAFSDPRFRDRLIAVTGDSAPGRVIT